MAVPREYFGRTNILLQCIDNTKLKLKTQNHSSKVKANARTIRGSARPVPELISHRTDW